MNLLKMFKDNRQEKFFRFIFQAAKVLRSSCPPCVYNCDGRRQHITVHLSLAETPRLGPKSVTTGGFTPCKPGRAKSLSLINLLYLGF